MGCFRKALRCVPLATFCLVLMATSVAAPSVAAAVQEPCLAVELVSLQEIATALQDIATALQEIAAASQETATALRVIATASNRSAELLSNDWSWIKVQVGLLFVTILGGVIARYLVDCGRKTWAHWGSLRPLPLEKVFTPLLEDLSKEVDGLGVQVAAAAERMATTTGSYGNEVSGLRAQVANLLQHLDTSAKKGAEALDRVAKTTACTERQLAAYVKKVDDLRSVVANLQDQLDEMNLNVEEIDKSLEDSEPRPNDVLPDPIEGEVVTPAYLQAATCLND